MPSQLPEAVVNYLAAYQAGNTSELHQCLAPNVLYLNVTDEGAMRTDGIAGVAEIVRGVHDMLSDLKLTVTEQHVDGGMVRLAGFSLRGRAWLALDRPTRRLGGGYEEMG
jgi:hypothetical protein